MVISIGAYAFCNGTLAGGVAISELRLRLDRVIEVVVPLAAVNPETFDRVCRRSEIGFTVKRTHANLAASEQFILQLEAAIPDSGTVTIIATGGAFSATIPNGKLLGHDLMQHIGATTFHNYRIAGGPPS